MRRRFEETFFAARSPQPAARSPQPAGGSRQAARRKRFWRLEPSPKVDKLSGRKAFKPGRSGYVAGSIMQDVVV